MRPQPRDVVYVTKAASVQFLMRPILFCVIRVHEWRPYCDGWIWLDGYEVNAAGDAVDRRLIYVQPAGLRLKARPGNPPQTRRTRPDRPAAPPQRHINTAANGRTRPRTRRVYNDFESQHRR